MSNENTYLPIIGGVGSQSAFKPITVQPEQTGGLVGQGEYYATLAALYAALSAATLKAGTYQIITPSICDLLITFDGVDLSGSGYFDSLTLLQAAKTAATLPPGKYRVGKTNFAYDGVTLTTNNAFAQNRLPNYNLARNALSKAIGRINVGIIGDSLSVGQFALPAAGSAYYSGGTAPYSLSALLAGVMGGNDNAFFGGVQGGENSMANLLAYDSRITQGAGTTWQTYQLSQKTIGAGFDAVGGTSAPLTITPNKSWDAVDIYYITNVGYGSVAITGAATGSINSNAALGIGSTTLTKTYGAGALTLTPTNENHIIGLVFYSTTVPSINFLKAGLGSSTSANWIDNTAPAWGALASLTALMAGPTGSNNPVHHWLVQLGANDNINGVAVATYKTNMQTLITQLKALTTNMTGGDIALMTTPPIPAGGNVTAATNAAYRQAVFDLGITNNLMVVDNYADFITFANGNANGWYSSANTVHQSAAGYAEVANNILMSGVLI